MNVLLLSHRFLPGSKEATKITINEFKNYLENKGHTVFLIAEKEIPETLKCVRALKKGGIQFDVIHVFSAAPFLAVKGLLVKQLFAPEARIIHTLKSYSRKLGGGLSFSFLLNSIDKITVSTQSFKDKLIKRGGNGENIIIINSHINLQKFVPMEKSVMKSNYGFSGRKVVFYYGSLHENKGVHYLLKAMLKIIEKHPDVLLLMAPRHAPSKEIQKEIDNLEEHVRVVTDDIDVVEFLNCADVLVLPYKNMKGTEGNPSCLLEAMACKVPIVTSDFPELREVVEPEEDVLIVPPGDVDAIALQVGRLLNDGELRKKLVDNAYFKSKKFDIENVGRVFLNIYSS